MTENKATYDAWAVFVPDAPPFSVDLNSYVAQLPRRTDGETWVSFKARIDYERDCASRGTDLCRAIYAQDPSERSKRFSVPTSDEDAVDTVFSKYAPRWPDTSKVASDVFLALARLTPKWSFVAVNHDPAQTDFCWSRPRCIFAGAGFENHAEIARILNDLYPQCGLDPAETKQEWDKQLAEAHKNCGYPAHLGLIPWKELTGVLSTEDDGMQEEWHRAVSMIHLLKHLRYEDSQSHVVLVYRSTTVRLEVDTNTNVLGQMKRPSQAILQSLGIPDGKHPLGAAFRAALNHATPGDLLRRAPLSQLSGLVLAGPWSTLVPDPVSRDGFVQHGCRLDGVWFASQGKVKSTTGEDDDILGYSWNIDTAGTSDARKSRVALERIIPSTFSVCFPSDVFFGAFPNLDLVHLTDLDAGRCLFDAPVLASLIRQEVEGLEEEYPFVAFLPSTPTLDESTNQGKSLAALTYSRMMVPAIRLTTSPDSSSAPDIRALADTFRTYGTACLDEWKMPTFKNHFLCRENLQSLCMGGDVPCGRAHENTGLITLKHPIVASSKALDMPPDMVNRMFTWFLKVLTDEQRADDVTLRNIKSGRLALQARLGAIAIIEQTGLVDALRALPHASSSSLRYGTHLALAKLLYKIRTGKPDTGQVDLAARQLTERFVAHTEDAEEVGLLQNLEEGKALKLRVRSLFENLSDTDVKDMQDYLRFKNSGACGHRKHPVLGLSALIEARMRVSGIHGQPYTNLLPALTGSKMRCSDRLVVMALGDDIRRKIPKNTGWMLPGALGAAGWELWVFDNGGSVGVWLEKPPPANKVTVVSGAPGAPVTGIPPSLFAGDPIDSPFDPVE